MIKTKTGKIIFKDQEELDSYVKEHNKSCFDMFEPRNVMHAYSQLYNNYLKGGGAW